MTMTIRVEYLPEKTKEIEHLTNDLLSWLDSFDVTAPLEDVERFIEAIDNLKEVLCNISLV